MTRSLYFAIPGDLATPTGGYAYDRRLIQELPSHGWEVEHVALPDGYPFPDASTLAATRRRLMCLPDHVIVLVDGLAFGAMPGIARELSPRLNLVALVHHPLADESGLSSEIKAALERSERAALADASAVICTSRSTAQRLIEGFGVELNKMAIAVPGTDTRPRSRGSGGDPPVIVSVGSLVFRKGHDVLLDALARLKHLPWMARILGAGDRDPECTQALLRCVKALGLAGRVSFLGAVADVDSELARADIFALATRHEGYGMAFAEALAHGLPIVGCRVGAVPEVVPATAGTLVPPDDAKAFAAALAPLLEDAAFRKSRANAAWTAAGFLPGWRETASAVAKCLAKLEP